jgi:hypothetical protein
VKSETTPDGSDRLLTIPFPLGKLMANVRYPSYKPTRHQGLTDVRKDDGGASTHHGIMLQILMPVAADTRRRTIEHLLWVVLDAKR